MTRIAIVGAGGFLGSRMVELGLLTGRFEPVPIIRSPKGAARLSKFGQVWQIANTADPNALAGAVKGCDAMLDVTVGSADRIEAATEALFNACRLAGVSRFIHVGTAEVFGRVEAPELSDDSPPMLDHWMPYARTKARAEMQLRTHLDDANVSVTILRPGLIWGPKSPWIAKPGAALIDGAGVLINSGRGIANLVFVDNLIEQFLAVARSSNGHSGCFNVSDDETTTWRQYYHAIAKQIGVDPSSIAQVEAEFVSGGLQQRIQDFKASRIGSWLKKQLSSDAKRTLKLLVESPAQPTSAAAAKTRVGKTDWHLQTVHRKLSNAKFRSTFGRTNESSFDEAMSQSGAWLRASGFCLTP